ncbi:unnamed protein product [Effrenium voratum]|uniref:Phosphopantothenate--cysteine ligase n=1 Tax=Effrenium voratum TaxID=2562239 RepID=A0AA36J0D4_9DINO|nr:unnamed protein product [Effrenium voratum]
MDAAAEAFFQDTKELQPADLERRRVQLQAFLTQVKSQNLRVALITSGGTTVPLEVKTVRFIDNFSSGTRGALCTQERSRSENWKA